MRSGHIFSLSALNVFGVYIGELQQADNTTAHWFCAHPCQIIP
jgi:hypothetical protein